MASKPKRSSFAGESTTQEGDSITHIPATILEPKKWDPKAVVRPQSSSLRSGHHGPSMNARASAAAAAVAFTIKEDQEHNNEEDEEFLVKRPVMNSFIVTKKRLSGVVRVPL